MFFSQQTDEETSSSMVQQDGVESDDSLLQPVRSSYIEDGSSSKESDINLSCTECDRSFRSVAGLRKHSMVQHNIHSLRSARKVFVQIYFQSFYFLTDFSIKVHKRKRKSSSSSGSKSSTVHTSIKKEKLVNILKITICV